jgi:hypothetical protein
MPVSVTATVIVSPVSSAETVMRPPSGALVGVDVGDHPGRFRARLDRLAWDVRPALALDGEFDEPLDAGAERLVEALHRHQVADVVVGADHGGAGVVADAGDQAVIGRGDRLHGVRLPEAVGEALGGLFDQSLRLVKRNRSRHGSGSFRVGKCGLKQKRVIAEKSEQPGVTRSRES